MEIAIDYHPRSFQQEIHALLDAHRFAVVVAHRRMGKTVAMINQMIKRSIVDGKRRGFYAYVAPLLKQGKSIAWEYLKHFTAPFPRRKINEQELYVELPNRARLRIFGADNPDSLRGLYFDGVVMDEVAQMRPEVWEEIVRPALADRQGWAVFIGTPKGINLFSELYDKARLDDSGVWAAKILPLDYTMAAADPPLPAEEVEQIKRETADNVYRQEYLCDFTASNTNGFIDFTLFQAAVDKLRAGRNMLTTMNRAAPLVFGLDPARFGDDRTALVVRRGRVLNLIEAWRDRDLMWTASRVSEIINKMSPQAVFVDVVGLGSGVVDRLRQLGHRVIGVNSGARPAQPDKFANLKAEMWFNMRDWLQEGAALPDDPGLRADLLAPTYDYDHLGRLRIEGKEDLKRRGLPSPDLADALALTFAQPVASADIFRQRPRFYEMN